MTRNDYIKSLILDSACNYYMDFSAIVSDVQKWAQEEGWGKIELSETLELLDECVRGGALGVFYLSTRDPARRLTIDEIAGIDLGSMPVYFLTERESRLAGQVDKE